MQNTNDLKSIIETEGFAVIENIYSHTEVEKILELIDAVDTSKETFRKSKDLFAIRQFLKEIPQVKTLVFNKKLQNVIINLFGDDFFVVKSIYFDKPAKSNWYVPYHQDLTISVDKKVADLESYTSWTTKQNQFAVQPPIQILENIFTVRIHLDETNENNGALKVLPKSHLNGVCSERNLEIEETFCNVNLGGIMIMKPLLFHSSERTTNKKNRRVIHIEFCNQQLDKSLQWAERTEWK